MNGNLWLFGGEGYNYLNPNALAFPLSDMWEYQGTQNYFGGDSVQNFWLNVLPPTVSSPVPSNRTGAVTWTDAAGDLWLFGGQDAFLDFLNDLWKYHIATNTWTYIGGGANLKGAYGTKGTPSTSNLPGSRWGANARLDTATGLVWLFGGQGFDDVTIAADTAPGLLNDLWTYNTANGQWTWVNGSNGINQTGNYGTLGTAAATNVPGGRETSAAWLDKSGNFWLFGGFDLDSKGNPAALNDLWEFKAGQWTWVSGANVANQTANYGVQGVGAATNVPGARWSSAAWADHNGNLLALRRARV